jgi:hypothetical protein
MRDLISSRVAPRSRACAFLRLSMDTPATRAVLISSLILFLIFAILSVLEMPWFLVSSSTSSFLVELPNKGNAPAPMAQAEGRTDTLIVKTATRKIFQNVMMAVGLVFDGSDY